MVRVITIAEWLDMFDASEIHILSQHVDTYAAISYITHGLVPLESRVSFPFAGVSVTPRGNEGVVIKTGLEFLARQGLDRVWLDVYSAPKEASMRRIERTYQSAAIVYGLLNAEDSQHLRQVLYAMRGLTQTLSLPQKGLPREYREAEPRRICPPSGHHYMVENRFWTRIWPFAELAVAKRFSYVIQSGTGEHAVVPLEDIIHEFHAIPRTFGHVQHPDPTRRRALHQAIEEDIRAVAMHVARITLLTAGAVVDPHDLLAKLIESPRYARDFESLLDAVAIFAPALDPTVGRERTRLGLIAKSMNTYNIVNEPTLGRYDGGNIVSSLYPPTGGAVWDEYDCQYTGGDSVSTKVLTRLGHVIGSEGTSGSSFPATWKLEYFFLRIDGISFDCFVGPLVGDMPTQIMQGGNKRKSAASHDSQHEGSLAVFLVDGIPKEHVTYVAARGDRYAYILSDDKKRIVGFIGYAILELIGFKLDKCAWELVHIDCIMS